MIAKVVRYIVGFFIALVGAGLVFKVSDDERVHDPYASIIELLIFIATCLAEILAGKFLRGLF